MAGRPCEVLRGYSYDGVLRGYVVGGESRVMRVGQRDFMSPCIGVLLKSHDVSCIGNPNTESTVSYQLYNFVTGSSKGWDL